MSVSRKPCEQANTSLARIVNGFGERIEQLRQRDRAQRDFETVECPLHRPFMETERAVLATELESYAVNLPEIAIDGERHRRVHRGHYDGEG